MLKYNSVVNTRSYTAAWMTALGGVFVFVNKVFSPLISGLRWRNDVFYAFKCLPWVQTFRLRSLHGTNVMKNSGISCTLYSMLRSVFLQIVVCRHLFIITFCTTLQNNVIRPYRKRSILLYNWGNTQTKLIVEYDQEPSDFDWHLDLLEMRLLLLAPITDYSCVSVDSHLRVL